jgi:hypothetical protein
MMSFDPFDIYFSVLGGTLFGVFMGTTFTRVNGRTLFWPLLMTWVFFFALNRVDDYLIDPAGTWDRFIGTTARWFIFIGMTLVTNAIVHRVRRRRLGL